MTCALEFQELASRNPFILDLDELGYHVDFVGGYLVIYGLPYLDKAGGLKHGDWVSPVDLNASGQIDAPSNHQAWWHGERPYQKADELLMIGFADNRIEVASTLVAMHSFSLKLQDENGQIRAYGSFEEKVQTYLAKITSPALALHPEATPLAAIRVKAEAQNSPLRFPDTSSARYHLNDVSSLLRNKAVAIVGLGGTGGYILDFIARTHLQRIALFDDDKVHLHTIFRMPGFIPHAIGQQKVDVLARHYSQWTSAIEPVNQRITEENIEQLRGFDFVFVSVDHGPARQLIVDWLSSQNIPFLDCGMGLNRSVVGLNGTVRITGVDRAAYGRNVGTAYLPVSDAKDDEYRRQAQIAELNALNAAFAVVRFKQHFKLFDRLDQASWYTFETASFELDSESTSQ